MNCGVPNGTVHNSIKKKKKAFFSMIFGDDNMNEE